MERSADTRGNKHWVTWCSTAGNVPQKGPPWTERGERLHYAITIWTVCQQSEHSVSSKTARETSSKSRSASRTQEGQNVNYQGHLQVPHFGEIEVITLWRNVKRCDCFFCACQMRLAVLQKLTYVLDTGAFLTCILFWFEHRRGVRTACYTGTRRRRNRNGALGRPSR